VRIVVSQSIEILIHEPFETGTVTALRRAGTSMSAKQDDNEQCN
jgi:hypothetical protein